ncbi:MAG: hypothetical protein KIT31_42390 [Deltaproteobacteria bacterium]|nr:hypothetical protein [Deltaproteobacteria bacterium]
MNGSLIAAGLTAEIERLLTDLESEQRARHNCARRCGERIATLEEQVEELATEAPGWLDRAVAAERELEELRRRGVELSERAP